MRSLLWLSLAASYIGYNLFLALLTVIISIIVFNCHHRDDKTAAVPRFIRVVGDELFPFTAFRDTLLY